jgi:PIN domain nuclease of toxin-antitoxin system
VILLDTHALVWWASDPGQIPARARRRIEDAAESADGVAVSSITVWEIAMLVSRDRLRLTIPLDAWLAHLEALPSLRFIAVSNQIALGAVRLDGFPGRDPADRMIVATAILLGATLVTADRRLRAYRPVSTVWS